LMQQGRRVVVALPGERDEPRALILGEHAEEAAQRAPGLDLEAAPVVRRRLDELVERRLVRLGLGEILPRLVDQRLIGLAQLTRLVANRADEAVEGGALIGVEGKVLGDLLDALGGAEMPVMRLGANPEDAADEEEIEGERQREQDPRQAQTAKSALRRGEIGRHVPLVSTRPKKPLGGSSNSSARRLLADCPSRAARLT